MSEENKNVLSKDVFEVYMKLNKESLDDLKNSVGLIFHKLNDQAETLARNTATVEDHRRRSDNLESRQEEFMAVMQEMKQHIQHANISLAKIQVRTDEIEKDIVPIQAHVNNVKNITNFLNSIYSNRSAIAKVIIFTIVVSTMVYYGVKESDFFMKVFK